MKIDERCEEKDNKFMNKYSPNYFAVTTMLAEIFFLMYDPQNFYAEDRILW